MSEQREAQQPNKYAKLPPPIRPEDMRTTSGRPAAADGEGRARPRDRVDAPDDGPVHLTHAVKGGDALADAH